MEKRDSPTHRAHFVPIVAAAGETGVDEIAFCMDDSNRTERRNVQGGSGLADEICNSRVGIGTKTTR